MKLRSKVISRFEGSSSHGIPRSTQKLLQILAAVIKQGTRHPSLTGFSQWRDCSQPVHAAASHQVKKKGFCIVIGMMRCQVYFTVIQQMLDQCIAPVPRLFLGALPLCYVELKLLNPQGDSSCFAKRQAMCLPTRCCCLQAVIEMHGPDFSGQFRSQFMQGDQQGGRVGTSAEAHPVSGCCGKKRQALQQALDAEAHLVCFHGLRFAPAPMVHQGPWSALEFAIGQKLAIARFEEAFQRQVSQFFQLVLDAIGDSGCHFFGFLMRTSQGFRYDLIDQAQ